jgi:hypothetical protein
MDFKGLDNEELINLRIAVEKEMKRRDITFEIGDIGEQIAIRYFNNTPGLSNLQDAPKGTKNVDALSRNGDRYSIKTVMKAKKTGTIYPDPQNKNKQLFEYLLIVKLGDNYTLEKLILFSWEQFIKLRLWDKRMSAWYIGCSSKTFSGGKAIYEK